MAKRRANGEGNIRKRPDGRWEGRYIAGHDENGKAIRKNVLGRTQAEIKEKLKKAIGECAEVDIERAEEYTVGAWVKTWYETYSKPHVRESTQRFYEDYIEHHIVPRIGSIKLTKLTGRDIQKMYNDVKVNGRIRVSKDGNTGMSASYVRGLHMMLHNCLGRAVKERLILRNPTEDCIVPKLEKKEMHILRPEDISAYLKEADRRGVLAMFFLELTTGLRKGELVALLWSDLDEQSMTLNVCKQAVGVKGGGVKVTRPKTETSIRRISLSQETIDVLKKEHEKHPELEIMFPSPKTLGMYYPDSITAIHNKILKSAGLPPHPSARPPPYLRHSGSPKRCRRKDGVLHPRSLRCRIYAPNLHPRYHKDAGRSRGDNGEADWGKRMSKIYTAISKRGRGTVRSTALCYSVLSALKSRWGQKWVRTGKRRKCGIDDSDS